jgi:queuine tRNA-ribosyltransferase
MTTEIEDSPMTSPSKKRSRGRKQAEQPIIVPPPANLDYPGFKFEVLHSDPASKARVGRLTTPHGTIETPNYIFCGTKGAIKGVSPDQMREARTDIILANTYHLMLQPGPDIIEKLGGLHQFTQWRGPMMTDSGGFQIFSMGHGGVADEIKGRNRKPEAGRSLLKITEQGAKFRSYVEGNLLELTAESSMEIQRKLGADLIYQFDECTAYHVDREYTAKSMERSHRWGDRSLAAFAKTHDGRQALYGITQGGVYEDLRNASCAWVNDRPFFGQAVGGCLGGSEEEMQEVVALNMSRLRRDRPTHLLGIGRIRDVFRFVRLGIDTFDCVSPTRIARHGWALTKGNPEERINLRNARFRDDKEPLDPSLDIPASRDFSKGYLHHLLKAGEMLGMQIVAQHNVALINKLMREVRAALRENRLDALQAEWLPD